MRRARNTFKKLVSRLLPATPRRRAQAWTGLEGLENRVLLSGTPITIGAVTSGPATSGTLVPGPVLKGSKALIEATGVTDPGGTITHVEFVLDADKSGTLNHGDLILGFGRESSTTPGTWELTTSTSNATIGVGSDQILVIATDKLKNTASATGPLTITDTAPTIKTLVAPKLIAAGNSFVLTALGVGDEFTKVTGVTFSLNGVVLGTVTGTGGYHLVVSPTLLTSLGISLPAAGQTANFTAVATDVDETQGTTLAQAHSKVVAPPTVGTLSVSPTTAAIGTKVTLSLSDVTAYSPASTSDKKIRVAFYYNAGANTTLGADSFFLGYGTFDKTTSDWVLTGHVAKKAALGADTLLAIAIDSDAMHSAPATTTLTVTAAAT